MIRDLRLVLYAAATVAALGGASCNSTAPARTSVMGRWTGSTVVGQEQWYFDMALTEQGDSVHGQSTLRSVPARVNLDEVVSGKVSGDSVQLLLRPVEDADIHIVASVSPDRLVGQMWMNAFVNDLHPIVLERQP